MATVGGVEWRIVKVSGEELASVGGSFVDLIDIASKREIAAAAQAGNEKQAKELATRKLAEAMNDANLKRMQEHVTRAAKALVCAGVTGAREPGKEAWEPVRFVLEERAADPSPPNAEDRKLWVGVLPAKDRDALAAAVQTLLTEGLSDRLARFRGKD